MARNPTLTETLPSADRESHPESNAVRKYKMWAVCLLQEVFINKICLYLSSDCSSAADAFTLRLLMYSAVLRHLNDSWLLVWFEEKRPKILDHLMAWSLVGAWGSVVVFLNWWWNVLVHVGYWSFSCKWDGWYVCCGQQDWAYFWVVVPYFESL